MTADPAPRDACLVVGFDRRPESLHALELGRDLGERLGADILVVHAVDLSDYPIDPDSLDWEDEAEQVLSDERSQAYGAMAGYPGGWSYVLRRGDPVSALLGSARDAGALMVIVGSRLGHRHAHVQHRLLDQADVPVLVVGHGSQRR